MSIQTIIWDLGGVLVRTEDVQPRQALADQLGLSRKDLEFLVFDSPSGRQAQLGALTADEHWLNVARELGVAPSGISDLKRRFWGGDRLDTELVDYIRRLRGEHTTALLSNAFADLRRFVVDRWQIADAFDHLVISAEVGLVKPDAAIYQLVLERTGSSPASAVFLDDFPENVAGAQACGLHAIHFRSPDQAREELSHLLNARLS